MLLVIKPDTVGWDQHGWRTVTKASEIDPRKGEKWRLLAPLHRASEEHLRICQQIWAEGNWCAAFDEIYYEKELGLEPLIIRFLSEGRAKGITTVVGMQRPAWVTKFAFSEPSHFFVGKIQRAEDVKRVRDELGRDVTDYVSDLDPYEFVYYNSITDNLSIVREDGVYPALGVRTDELHTRV